MRKQSDFLSLSQNHASWFQMVSFSTSVYILSNGATHRWHLGNSPSILFSRSSGSPGPRIRSHKRKRVCCSLTVCSPSIQFHEFEMLRSKFEMWKK